jgi:hypothetical protein
LSQPEDIGKEKKLKEIIHRSACLAASTKPADLPIDGCRAIFDMDVSNLETLSVSQPNSLALRGDNVVRPSLLNVLTECLFGSAQPKDSGM